MDYIDYKYNADKNLFWFKGKVRLIEILISRVLDNKKNLKILDVGAGVKGELEILQNWGKIYVIDKNEKILDFLPKGLLKEIRIEDICFADFPDNYFDLIVCSDVLEHCKNDAEAISQIVRMLKPKGYLIFTVPAFGFISSSHDWALGHFRRYNPIIIKKKMRNLVCREIGFWFFFLFFPALVKRMLIERFFSTFQMFPDSVLKIPTGLNNLLSKVLEMENLLIKHKVTFPFGLTIYGIYQKA